ncbi:hypothetical protein SBF1_4320010 [Candidatus Desulfosporosinus infrequens]|uniref:Uncharacterized protein n=1 Tax=Candidatus Desulfosporosinus infrequens TaxID=2043169 RepID=A0A2U3LBD0_9FIRM|nr:hypothetical protein SBF1_4320010 [Candidatus Desulfosporosinus infrequens]
MINEPNFYFLDKVAPYAGAWIEITNADFEVQVWTVAPYAGAWIEMG